MASSQNSGTGYAPTAPCPKCKNDKDPKRPGFTWWGGVLGPKLLNHAICANCGTGYNAKSGKSNLGPVILYQVITCLIAIALLLVVL